jgi:cystathionine beta-lyase/cystathionine gamma-synthase
MDMSGDHPNLERMGQTKMEDGACRKPATRMVHARHPMPQDCRPLSMPIYQSSTFAFEHPEALAEAMAKADGEFVYSRRGNPTVRALEELVADLEGGAVALATASGMGAISAVLLSHLRAGDHVIAQRCLYGGTFSMLSELSARFGIEVSYLSSADPDEVRRLARSTTRLLWLESIANPTTQVIDLPAYLSVGRELGLIGVVDNSFASPVLCRPLEYGADIVIHSSTKYLGGHSDVTGGIAVFGSRSRYEACWKIAVELGSAPDPFAAWLTIRGIQTLELRVRRQCETARWLSTQLGQHPAVEAVYWPGRPEHPDHAVAARLLGDFGAVLAFDVAGGRQAGERFLAGLKMIGVALSLGGVETLALHPASTSHRELDAVSLSAAGIGSGTVRLSAGLEHPDDIWSDLERALTSCVDLSMASVK